MQQRNQHKQESQAPYIRILKDSEAVQGDTYDQTQLDLREEMEQEVIQREKVEEIVRQLGFRSSNEGTSCLVEAVLFCCQEQEALFAVARQVYPAVAKRTGKDQACVEHSLLNTVAEFWEQGNRDQLNQMAGFVLLLPPTVGEVISYILARLQG